MADDAGALLVRSGLIAAEHLAAARAVCAQVGGTLGEHLVAAGLISDEALTEFYRSRLLVPQVNPNSLARLAPDVVSSVPPDMAVEFRVVPVSMDREGNLTVAMSDPSNRHAVDEIAFFTGKYVVRAVATQMQIAWCLAHYYGHITDLGTRLLRPTGAEGATPPAGAAAIPKAAPARPRGDTGRVDAARHRALAPITRPPLNESRPDPKMLDPNAKVAAPAPAAPAPRPPVLAPLSPLSPLGPVPPRAPAAKPPSVPPPIPAAALRQVAAPNPAVPAISPTATTLVPGQISASDVAAAAASASGDDSSSEGEEQVIEIADYPSGPVANPPTQPTGPVGRGRQEPNPPELAARTGEMLVRDPTFQMKDEPAVVIAIDKLEPSAPVVVIEAEGERSRPAPLEDDDDEGEGDEDTEEPGEITDETPAIVHDKAFDPDSAPILLDRKRTVPDFVAPREDRADTLDEREERAPTDRDAHEDSDAATPAREAEPSESDVVLLSRPKPRPTRKEKRTQLGIGAIGAMVPRPAVATDDATSPGVSVLLTAPPEIQSEGDRTIRVPVDYAPDAGEATEPGSPPTGSRVVAGTPTATSDPVADGVPRAFVDDDEDRKTHPVDLGELRLPRPARSAEVDDGWGPPGTTIPPPFLGAVQGTEETNPSLKIPIPSVDDDSGDSGPLIVKPATGPLADAAARAADAAAGVPPRPIPAAPTVPSRAAAPAPRSKPVANKTLANPIPPIPSPGAAPPPAAKKPTAPPAATLLAAPPRPPTSPITASPAAADLGRDLEEAATTLLELLRELEKTQTRDAAIELLVGHLARSHARVGFFAVKGGELQPLALRPKPPGPLPTLLLSRASTFQDVVGTRLPYRGPVVDDATRRLLVAAFASAPDEMLALPVAIKDRVVGIAYGDSRQRHTFDEQLAIAARAAGQALERILRETKKAM